ncbi:MAG: phytoene desaturase family protein [Phycisphaerales bacterium]
MAMTTLDRPRSTNAPGPARAARGRSVAVVGAGPGGLASAMLLASSGLSVTVYEAHSTVGGRTRRLEEGPYRFDCGPTFFMMPWVLEEIFAATGRRLADYAKLTRLDPMYRLLIGQPSGDPLVIDTTQDLARMERQLDAVNPGDGAAFQRFIRDNRRKLERMTPLLRRPIRGMRDLVAMDTLRVGPLLRPWQSLYDHLGGYFGSESVRLAMSFQSKYLGMSPFECPELFSILPFIEYEYGIWHPEGGCNALMAAMAQACQEMGVEIRCGAPVERVLFDGRRACGVAVAGEERRHEHVVLNADASWALSKLVPEHLRPRALSDASLERKRYSCSTFMLYLGLEGEVDLPHHTIYTSRSYVENLRDISERGRISADPSTYICNPSRTDPTLAPAGHSALYLLVPTPNNQPGFCQVDWRLAAGDLRERALQQAEQVFGIADIRRRIRAERMVTPADWEGERIRFGATFNLAHGLGQMLHRRPHHRVQGMDNLWLVGGGTHPGSGLPVIFLSAEITAKLLCAELGAPCPLSASRGARPAEPAQLASALLAG